MLGSPPPSRAATMRSRAMRAHAFDFLASVAAFWRLIFDHLLCPAMLCV